MILKRLFSSVLTIGLLALSTPPPVFAQSNWLRTCYSSTGQTRPQLDQDLAMVVTEFANLEKQLDQLEAQGFQEFGGGLDSLREFGMFDEKDIQTIQDLQRRTIEQTKQYTKQLQPYIRDSKDSATVLLKALQNYYQGKLQAAIDSTQELSTVSRNMETKAQELRTSKIKPPTLDKDLEDRYIEFALRMVKKFPVPVSEGEIQRQMREQASKQREIQKQQNEVWAQTLLQNVVLLQAINLTITGNIYIAMGQSQRALDSLTQAFTLLQTVGDQSSKASVLNNIGAAYFSLERYGEALQAHQVALQISQRLRPRTEAEASELIALGAQALYGIGLVQSATGKYQEALQNYGQSLSYLDKVCDDSLRSNLLSAIGQTYLDTGNPQKALEFLTASQQVFESKINASWLNIDGLTSLGVSYRDTNKPPAAINALQTAVQLALQVRGGLLRADRKVFLQSKAANTILVDLLINQNQPELAYKWVNLATTADLVDYTRLMNATQVANPDARRAIAEWSQQNQQLQLLRLHLQEAFSESRSRQMRQLEAQVNQQAEQLSRRFPDIADLFETTPADVNRLKASIPLGTVVIQPVLLTRERHVQDAIATFILTRDSLSVVKTPFNSKDYDALLTQTYAQLTNRFDSGYSDNLAKLYDLIIRPIEAKLEATKPRQLSIIATGKLRYLPFEVLYDHKTDQYLLKKYPINYLTRLSTRSLETKATQNLSTSKLLALGNPVPKAPLALPDAENEVKSITQILPGSEFLLRDQATLDAFKVQAPRFSLLHLATHGCFQQGGCPKLGLEANTLLFADQKLKITDAALLGLQNVNLITLSACQTALEASSNGEEIAGLAYLFERAGAKATLASLWSAEDSTTQAIMVQFYTNLKNGMSKSEALQQAKLSQIASHPYFWAPFVLIGDAR